MTEPGLAAVWRAAQPWTKGDHLVTARFAEASEYSRRLDGEIDATGTEDPGGGSIGHAVMFYRAGDDFAGRVSGYLLQALREGGAAIVIATPEHRRAISDRLARAGADVAAAEATGAFLALDAVETMGRFTLADWPNAASFWQVISPVIQQATGAFTPVHVFGDMAGLFWDLSPAGAAIEVEAMWNELAAQYPFSLLCAYPAESVRGAHHQDALAEVCRVHASVAGDVPAEPGRG